MAAFRIRYFQEFVSFKGERKRQNKGKATEKVIPTLAGEEHLKKGRE